MRPQTVRAGLEAKELRLAGARLPLRTVRARAERESARLEELGLRARDAALRGVRSRAEAATGAAKLLKSLSYEGVLARGYALLRDEEGAVIRSAGAPAAGAAAEVRFADGARRVVFDGEAAKSPDGGGKTKPARAAKTARKPAPAQARLFD